jgi:hypothetical protein
MNVQSLLVFPLRSVLGDCSANGSTAKYNQLYLYSEKDSLEDILKDIESKGRLPEQCLIVKKRHNGHIYCVPAHLEGTNSIYMAGGNFVYTSHTFFKTISGCEYPISVHDRVETQEAYNHLSI